MFIPVTDEDLPEVVKLLNRAYRGSGAAASWNTEATFLAGDRTTLNLLRGDLLATPEARLFKWVATPLAAITGCVWLQPEGFGTWYLGSLAADPELQNAGLGRTMLVEAEEWVRAHGGQRVRIRVVNVRDTLIAWYIRRGYDLSGEIEPFPYGGDQLGIPLRDDLAFVVLVKSLLASRGAG